MALWSSSEKRLTMAKKVSHGFESSNKELAIEKLCLSIKQSMGTVSKSMKDKGSDRRGQSPSIVCCAQSSVGL